MNKGVKISLITAASVVAAIGVYHGSVTLYNRYIKTDAMKINTAVQADTLVTSITGAAHDIVASVISKKAQSMLWNNTTVDMVAFVAKLDGISFETQLVNIAKAKLITDGYLTVSGTII